MSFLFGVLVGFSLGLTGGGASIFAVPLLTYGLHLPARQAVTVSLAAVGATALGGVIAQWRRRQTEFRTGVIFGLAGVGGAPAGAWLGRQLPAPFLLSGFALLMLLVAFRLWRRAHQNPAETKVIRAVASDEEGPGPGCRREPQGNLYLTSRCALVLTVTGIVTGFLAGLFGVGGGFLIVPALVFIASLSIQRAVATSLLVIAIISTAGLTAHILGGQSVDWQVAAWFALGGLAGMGGGMAAGRRLAGPVLQKLFAGMMVAVAVFMLVRNLLC